MLEPTSYREKQVIYYDLCLRRRTDESLYDIISNNLF